MPAWSHQRGHVIWYDWETRSWTFADGRDANSPHDCTLCKLPHAGGKMADPDACIGMLPGGVVAAMADRAEAGRSRVLVPLRLQKDF